MISDKTTVVLEKNGVMYKLMKVIFGKDGSYFITAPYHDIKSAYLSKVEMDYRKKNNG